MRKRILGGLSLSILLFGLDASSSMAYDAYIYTNLQRSRDALLAQRADLERARADVSRQIDQLQQKAARIDVYLKEADSSIRDVNDALSGMR